MRDRVAFMVVVALGLTLGACSTSSGDGGLTPVTKMASPAPVGQTATPAESPPAIVVAYPLEPTGEASDRTRIFTPAGHVDVVGRVAAVLTNGTVLVDRFPRAGLKGLVTAVVDSKTGKDIAVETKYGPGAWQIGAPRAVTIDSLLEITNHAGRRTLRQFDLHLRQTRAVPLPGSNPRYDETRRPHGVSYGAPAKIGRMTFVETSEVDGIDATSDSVTRIDESGQIESILNDEHVTNLRTSSDGTSLLATVAASAPLYEAIAATEAIVELDPKSGDIVKSYGVPPPCAHYEPVQDDASCIDRFDKVGPVLVATVFESSAPSDDGWDGYSTWRYTGGRWAEITSQRGKLVMWQSASQHIELRPTLKYGDQDAAQPIYLVDGDKRRALPGSNSIFADGWDATGSLVPEE